MAWRLSLLALFAVACGSSGSGPDPVDPGDDGRAGLMSAKDRCPMLLDCHDEPALASCPDPFFEFRAGSAELVPETTGLLEGLVAEVQATPRLRSVRIQGHAASGESEQLAGERATTIRDWLIEAGVDDRMLEVGTEMTSREGSAYATIEVLDCSGSGGDDDRVNAGGMLMILF